MLKGQVVLLGAQVPSQGKNNGKGICGLEWADLSLDSGIAIYLLCGLSWLGLFVFLKKKYHKLDGLNNKHIFLHYGGWEMEDQSTSRFGVWLESASWLVGVEGSY